MKIHSLCLIKAGRRRVLVVLIADSKSTQLPYVLPVQDAAEATALVAALGGEAQKELDRSAGAYDQLTPTARRLAHEQLLTRTGLEVRKEEGYPTNKYSEQLMRAREMVQSMGNMELLPL